MNLSPPTTALFVVTLILAALAIIGAFLVIPFVSEYRFWILAAAYVVLAIGNLFRGA
ncbi:MAG: hypothetical protein ACREDO_08665 [Methyloceanibacter sp.]